VLPLCDVLLDCLWLLLLLLLFLFVNHVTLIICNKLYNMLRNSNEQQIAEQSGSISMSVVPGAC
jgi:hypothetical protein